MLKFSVQFVLLLVSISMSVLIGYLDHETKGLASVFVTQNWPALMLLSGVFYFVLNATLFSTRLFWSAVGSRLHEDEVSAGY